MTEQIITRAAAGDSERTVSGTGQVAGSSTADEGNAGATRRGITLSINGSRITVAQGITVAAAIAIAGCTSTRRSVSGEPRAPLCGMGVCQECRVTIDGHPHQLACQTLCVTGMQVSTDGAERGTP